MITYHKGSLTEIKYDPSCKNYIVHCVNDAGIMGSGVARALYTKWPEVKQDYETLFSDQVDERFRLKLGRVGVVEVEPHIYVVNLVGQSDPGGYRGLPPVRYQSIEEGLMRLKNYLTKQATPVKIYGPRFGCALAGGSWSVIEEIINRVGLDFQIYDIDDNWNK